MIEEPARSIPVLEKVDVLIVGGGPAGVAAAVGAARCNKKVLLVERYGFLGGMWTAGLVLTLAGFNSWLKPYPRCVDGIGGEWLRRATERGFAEDNPGWVLNSEPDGMKLIADELIEEAGVIPLYHSWAATPIVENRRVFGVYVENVDGRSAILADITVDCTGNGDMIFRSGAEWIKGNTLQPLTLAFDFGNVHPNPAISHEQPRCLPIGPEPVLLSGQLLKTNASRRLDVELDYDKFNKDRLDGNLPLFGGPWVGGLHKDVVWMNTVRVVADGSVAGELTTAEIRGRKDAFKLTEYFKKNIPGFEKGRIQRLAAQIGVRETRRLKGLYVLSGDDVRRCTPFPDTIGLGCWSIDIHPTETQTNHSMYVPLPFHIPYGSLIPTETGGLLCAGRCISVDREALASVRVGATCCVTGHAAGVAAALCAEKALQPFELSPGDLQAELRNQKAMLELPG
jgi:hypothetical protein